MLSHTKLCKAMDRSSMPRELIESALRRGQPTADKAKNSRDSEPDSGGVH